MSAPSSNDPKASPSAPTSVPLLDIGRGNQPFQRGSFARSRGQRTGPRQPDNGRNAAMLQIDPPTPLFMGVDAALAGGYYWQFTDMLVWAW